MHPELGGNGSLIGLLTFKEVGILIPPLTEMVKLVPLQTGVAVKQL